LRTPAFARVPPWRYLMLAATLLAAAQSQAQDAAMVLAFGGEPGAPLPHSYNYGAPQTDAATYTMRVPIFDRDVAPVFADSELTVDIAAKTVRRVHSERAFKSLTECTAAKGIVEKKLAAVMPSPYTGSDPAWQYAKGGAVGGIYCNSARHLPYAILTLDLAVAPAP
jgi:hypothetical protein